jgi:hypothetical protein
LDAYAIAVEHGPTRSPASVWGNENATAPEQTQSDGAAQIRATPFRTAFGFRGSSYG